jgi:hypothetical protein
MIILSVLAAAAAAAEHSFGCCRRDEQKRFYPRPLSPLQQLRGIATALARLSHIDF